VKGPQLRPLYPIWTQAIFERKMGKFKIPACIALFLREKLVARVYNMFLYIIVAGEEKTRRIRGDIDHAHSKVRCSIGLIRDKKIQKQKNKKRQNTDLVQQPYAYVMRARETALMILLRIPRTRTKKDGCGC
jgi:hypothetical protein